MMEGFLLTFATGLAVFISLTVSRWYDADLKKELQTQIDTLTRELEEVKRKLEK